VFDDNVLAEIGSILVVDDFRDLAGEHTENIFVWHERWLIAFEVAASRTVGKHDACGLAGGGDVHGGDVAATMETPPTVASEPGLTIIGVHASTGEILLGHVEKKPVRRRPRDTDGFIAWQWEELLIVSLRLHGQRV
jgi:hypothetical protein